MAEANENLPEDPMIDPSDHGNTIYLAGICLVASLGGLLFGFDTAVISGTVEPVTEQFGLTDIQQGWFTSAALICLVATVLFFRFVPETKGKSLEEIERSWNR